MKKFLGKSLAAALVLAFCVCTTIFASSVKQMIEVYKNYATIVVNGKVVDTDSFMFNGTNYIPLRDVSELLGKEVEWDQKTKTAYIDDKNLDKNPSKEYENNVVDDPNSIFKGYFQNVDYKDPNIFLQSYSQTAITPVIQEIADEFNDKKDLSTLGEIYLWMDKNLKSVDGEKFGRTSNEILTAKNCTGCTDYGLAFIALARAKGIPAVFVQCAKIDWINEYQRDVTNRAQYIQGHIFVEVYIDLDGNGTKEWCIVDSTAGKLYKNYDKDNFSLNDGYYIFAKSIEVWDSGAKNESQNYNTMLDIFKDFNPDYYVNPKYQYIDLLHNEVHNAEKYDESKTESQAVILGDKEPVEMFGSYLSDSDYLCKMAAIFRIREQDVKNSELLVILLSGDYDMPPYILEIVPEFNDNLDCMNLDIERDGKRIIVIKTQTKEDLIKAINEYKFEPVK